MANTVKREIVAVLWSTVQTSSELTPQNIDLCKRAGELYTELRSEGIEPIVIVGSDPKVQIPLSRKLVTSRLIIDHLDKSNLIPSNHIINPVTEGERANENGEQTAQRIQGARKTQGQGMTIHVLVSSN